MRLVAGEVVISRSNGSVSLIGIDNNNSHKVIASPPPIGDRGDIVVSNAGDTWTIDVGAVNDSKFSGVLSLAKGGTGASTQPTAINNLLPSQTGNATKVLTTNGTNVSWGSATGSINDLTDVDTVTLAPANGNVLIWNSTTSQWIPGTVSTVEVIDDLNDVDTITTAPVDGNALLWNQALGQWVPGVASTVGILDDLTDVTITAPLEMQYLVYEEATSQWKNKEVPIWGAPGDGGDFDTGTIATVGNVWPDGGDFGT